MNLRKLSWVIRLVLYKPFMGSVGTLSYMGRPCFLEGVKKIFIGNKVRIFPGIRMEAIGKGSIDIGDNVAIEQNVHIISKDNALKIGKDTTISANVFITNTNHKYEDITKSVMDQGYELKCTEIGDGCFIGYGASIQAGTTLGNHCIVGTNAVVKGIFPDNCVIAGVPAKIKKIYNTRTNSWEKYYEDKFDKN